MSRSILFHTPYADAEVGRAELKILRNELEKIADGSPRLTAAAALAAKLDSLAGKFEPDPSERFALLRAADHLRNLARWTELEALRDLLYGSGGVEWIAYRLCFLDGRPPSDFTSYSLRYEVGDRLVTPSKDELRVIDIDVDGDPPRLTVEPWRGTD